MFKKKVKKVKKPELDENDFEDQTDFLVAKRELEAKKEKKVK